MHSTPLTEVHTRYTFYIGVNITDTKNIIGRYSITVLLAQQRVTAASGTCMCTPTQTTEASTPTKQSKHVLCFCSAFKYVLYKVNYAVHCVQ